MSRRLARVSKRKTPITEEAQSKPTAELRREGRLARIAKALDAGATVTDIAEAEGPLGLLVSPRCPVVSHPLRYYLTFRGRHALSATSGQGLRLLPLSQRFEILNDFTEPVKLLI